jgi:hypothetical protein
MDGRKVIQVYLDMSDSVDCLDFYDWFESWVLWVYWYLRLLGFLGTCVLCTPYTSEYLDPSLQIAIGIQIPSTIL